MNELEELAELIFPNVDKTISDLEKMFPFRNLKEGAKVTRFAPSPTGFLHTGSLFTSMISYKIAKDTGGVFYVRLEDTDTKREIEGSGEKLIAQLNDFDIVPSEGYLGNKEVGNYGPYKQSERKWIYDIVIKEMIKKGLAYPCFASESDLAKLREEQTKNKEITGYYGKYAIYRNLETSKAIQYIKEGKPFVIRFKSSGNHLNKIKVHDEIRGDLELTENDQDIVIMKLDNGNRRKLSKRKDKEASVDYFLESGYEPKAILVYLMTIANSNYEDFLVTSKDYDLDHFKFNLKKMSLDGALFDNDKLNYYGKEILSKMNKEEISLKAYEYAKKYDLKLKEFIEKDFNRFKEIMNIEREKKNPRKDYAKYGDIYEIIKFFDSNEYIKLIDESTFKFKETLTLEKVKEFLNEYLKTNYLDYEIENDWFNNVKETAQKVGFCIDNKIYKENPSDYIGNVNDACEILRVSLTSRNITPNLFSIMKILGKDECTKRFNFFLKRLNNI